MRSESRKRRQPQRGDIWIVNFNSPVTAKTPPAGAPKSQWPTTGDEINKVRPAIVMNVNEAWEKQLHIVVPLRQWHDRFARNGYFWIVPIVQDDANKLRSDSGADAFQVKSISLARFIRRIGIIDSSQLDAISATIAFCIGHWPGSTSALSLAD